MSLYDRSYMRGPTGVSPEHSAVKTLLIAIGISFFIQHLGGHLLGFYSYTDWLALSWDNVSSGLVYTLFSYAFLHDGIFHLAINGLILYIAGRTLSFRFSNKDLYSLFFFAVLVGAICFLLINQHGSAIGASAAVLAFLSMVLLLRYNEPITLLLFFVFPVTQTGKVFLLFLAGFEIFGLLAWELRGTGGIGHSAHLGGMLGALLFYRWKFGTFPWQSFSYGSGARSTEKKKWFRPGKYKVNIGTESQEPSSKGTKAEIDRILEKISAHGMGSLTEEEKRTLHNASSKFK